MCAIGLGIVVVMLHVPTDLDQRQLLLYVVEIPPFKLYCILYHKYPNNKCYGPHVMMNL